MLSIFKLKKPDPGTKNAFITNIHSIIPVQLGEPGEAEPGVGGGAGGSNFWSLSYYQQCFEVEDKDVLSRLLYSMVPIPGK